MSDEINYWQNKRMSRRRMLKGGLAVGAGMVGLGIAGCGDSGTARPASSSPTTTAPSASTPSAAPTATQGPAKPTGKITIACTPPGIETFDPFDYVNSPQDVSYLPLFYEGLTGRDLTGKITPWLASKWGFRENGQKWDFEIRKGIKFHNGDPLTAADVKFSYDRGLKDAAKWKQGFAVIPHIDSIDQVDDYNVTFNLKKPYAIFPSIVSVSIIPKSYFEKVGVDGFGKAPVGTGPFRLANWAKGTSMEFEATEQHWRSKPTVKTILLRHAADQATRVAMLRAKEVDLAIDLPAQSMKEIQADSNLRVDVSKDAGKNWFWFLDRSKMDGDKFVENKASPFADKRVRQAANYAINRQAIADKIYSGQASPAVTIVQPGDFGSDSSLKPYPFDPAKAKALLAEAGFPNGFTTDIYAGSVGNNADILQVVAGFLTDVGIKANPQVMEGGSLLQKERNRQLGGLGYVSTSRQWDAVQILGYYSQTGPWSMTADPDFDKLLAQAQGEPDDAKREALARQAHKIEYDDAHNLFMLYYHLIHGANKRVSSWPTQGYYAFLNFADQIKLTS